MMRTEKEMFALILEVAQKDERIRGVLLNGSRTNPLAPKDIFQDFDVVYLVKETASFIKDKSWLAVFGKPLIFQFPDELDASLGRATDSDRSFGYLMQFADGNRIDLTVQTLDAALETCRTDSLTTILLDKDGILPMLRPSSDKGYHVTPPTQAEFAHCCNEFWWVSLYIGKGLWREEPLYALEHLHIIRTQLIQMLSWYAGLQNNFSISVGKCGKYLDRYLPAGLWTRLLDTYPQAEVVSVWNATICTCKLFEEAALPVGTKFELTYPHADAQRSLAFLQHIRQLPKDATSLN